MRCPALAQMAANAREDHIRKETLGNKTFVSRFSVGLKGAKNKTTYNLSTLSAPAAVTFLYIVFYTI